MELDAHVNRDRKLPPKAEMYRALTARDSRYEGVFVVAVKTTGIFCRPTCSARNPKPENVEYFGGIREAMCAGYRPCKRCRPLARLGDTPAWLEHVLASVEAEPAKRWRDRDLRALGVEPSRVRRWFRRHHGMTFHAYSRARRLGAALGQIRSGSDVTGAAFDSGYESLSGFHEAFANLFGQPPTAMQTERVITVNRVLTPLGALLAGESEGQLCLLEFADRKMLATQLRDLQGRLAAHYVPGDTPLLRETQAQLEAYFGGRLRDFQLPLSLPGTDFQVAAWRSLMTIPYGTTRSYAEQARRCDRPNAVRAIGTANGRNRVAIVVPCHRVVGADGSLCGYGGELWRKQALLDLERKHA